MGEITTQPNPDPAPEPGSDRDSGRAREPGRAHAPDPVAAGRSRAPLLLTLGLAEPAQGVFQALRLRHFPPERNVVPAHVSLFHALPGEQRHEIGRVLHALDAARPEITVGPPHSLGRGVAFRLSSPELQALRGRLADAWSDWLTPQDRAPYRPHVTVQNKVTPERARATLALLAENFVPWRTEGCALLLWRYLGGPWEPVERLVLKPRPLPPSAGFGQDGRTQPGRTSS